MMLKIDFKTKIDVFRNAEKELALLEKIIQKTKNLRPKNLFNFYGYDMDVSFLDSVVDVFSSACLIKCGERKMQLEIAIDAILSNSQIIDVLFDSLIVQLSKLKSENPERFIAEKNPETLLTFLKDATPLSNEFNIELYYDSNKLRGLFTSKIIYFPYLVEFETL